MSAYLPILYFIMIMWLPLSSGYISDILLSVLSVAFVLGVSIVYLEVMSRRFELRLFEIRGGGFWEQTKLKSIIKSIAISIGLLFFLYLFGSWKPGRILLVGYAQAGAFLLFELYASLLLKQAVYQKGIITGNGVTKWNRIKSYDWREMPGVESVRFNLVINSRISAFDRKETMIITHEQKDILCSLLKPKANANGLNPVRNNEERTL